MRNKRGTIRYDCSVCLETKRERRNQIRSINGDRLCSDCVQSLVPIFEAALAHEIDYPPRFGGAIIPFDDFQDLFSRDFSHAWRTKVKEYETPVKERLYCIKSKTADGSFCNAYLGNIKFGGYVHCLRCKCSTQVKANQDEESHALDGAIRGKDYQVCPGKTCGVKSALREGCNHVTCHFCYLDFCFLCGQEAGPDSGHWTREQGCPRWGGLGGGDAIFDDSDGDSEDDDSEGDDPGDGDENAASQHEISPNINFHREEAFTLRDEFAVEVQDAADENGNEPALLLDMLWLIQDLAANLEWMTSDQTLHSAQYRADRAADFNSRHQRLVENFIPRINEALRMYGFHSVLRTMGADLLAGRYFYEHHRRYVESMQEPVDVQEAEGPGGVQDEDLMDWEPTGA